MKNCYFFKSLIVFMLFILMGCEKDIDSQHSKEDHEVVSLVALAFNDTKSHDKEIFVFFDSSHIFNFSNVEGPNAYKDTISLREGRTYSLNVLLFNTHDHDDGDVHDDGDDTDGYVKDFIKKHVYKGEVEDLTSIFKNYKYHVLVYSTTPSLNMTHEYLDNKDNGVVSYGFKNKIVTSNTGTGDFRVQLKHSEEVPITDISKVDEIATTEIDITFPIVVK